MKKQGKKFKNNFSDDEEEDRENAGRYMWAKEQRKQKPKAKKFKYKDL